MKLRNGKKDLHMHEIWYNFQWFYGMSINFPQQFIFQAHIISSSDVWRVHAIVNYVERCLWVTFKHAYKWAPEKESKIARILQDSPTKKNQCYVNLYSLSCCECTRRSTIKYISIIASIILSSHALCIDEVNYGNEMIYWSWAEDAHKNSISCSRINLFTFFCVFLTFFLSTFYYVDPILSCTSI
jgi:hypothetical protein